MIKLTQAHISDYHIVNEKLYDDKQEIAKDVCQVFALDALIYQNRVAMLPLHFIIVLWNSKLTETRIFYKDMR